MFKKIMAIKYKKILQGFKFDSKLTHANVKNSVYVVQLPSKAVKEFNITKEDEFIITVEIKKKINS